MGWTPSTVDRDIGVPVHGRNVVHEIYSTEHKNINLKCNNKIFYPLKISPDNKTYHGSRGTMANYHYYADPMLGVGKYDINIFQCVFIT